MKKLLLWFVVCSLVVGSTSQAQAAPFTQIVAFGDSLTDEGNVSLAMQGMGQNYPVFPPYYTDPSYLPLHVGTYSNGPAWISRFASLLGVPDPKPNLVGGTNFAWGGAETHNNSLNGLSTQLTPNLDTQIGAYLQANPSGFHSNQMIVLWGGANDFYFGNQTNPTLPAMYLANEIAYIYSQGGREFLVANLPLLGEVPGIPKDPLNPFSLENQLNAATYVFNSTLAQQEDLLGATLPGLSIHRLDVAGLFAQAMVNPSAFGLTNTTDPAKPGDIGWYDPAIDGPVVDHPEEYMFWDKAHPTDTVERFIGTAAYNTVIPEPSTAIIWTLLGTIGIAVGWWRRKEAA